jgi:hypothetical protein
MDATSVFDVQRQLAIRIIAEETPWWEDKTWLKVLLIIIGAQALIGIMMIEYAFSRLKRFRDGNEERDAQFPAFRRRDVKKWHRCKFYPIAMLGMPFRMIFLIT